MENKIIQIQNIAERVRKEFEQKNISKEELVQLYSEYNPSVNGSIFVDEAEKMFPKLNCGLTSLYLQKMLGGEIIQGTYNDNGHTYLLVDKQIVDITADQYGGPKIYVGKLKLPWKIKSN